MPVTSERRGRVLIARLERPEKRNAMNAEMTRGLDAAMNELEDDPELWVGLLGAFAVGVVVAAVGLSLAGRLPHGGHATSRTHATVGPDAVVEHSFPAPQPSPGDVTR